MTTIPGVEYRGTAHCETTTLGVLLRHAGIDLTEPMLFGLGSGLSFVYWDDRRMAFPFLGGRVRPFELTRTLTARLGLALEVHETTSGRRAWTNVTAALAGGRPVGLQLDSHHLDYFSSSEHFGGHVVALVGHDERDAFLVDTAQQGGAVSTSRTSLAAARAARGPMTARHRSFTVAAPGSPPDLREHIVPAIGACARAFLDPPIANLGHRGIAKGAALVPGWWQRSDDPPRDLTRTAVLMQEAGTGGALFRNLYRDFLAECLELVDLPLLRTGHARYAEAAPLWEEVAALIGRAGRDGSPQHLDSAGTVLHELARLEREAMAALRDLDE